MRASFVPGPTVPLATSADAAVIPSAVDLGSVPLCHRDGARVYVTTGDPAGIAPLGTYFSTVEILSWPPSTRHPHFDGTMALVLAPAGTGHCGADAGKPSVIYPDSPCTLYTYFSPSVAGVYTLRGCLQYTRNEDPPPKPVHQVCYTLTGRGV